MLEEYYNTCGLFQTPWLQDTQEYSDCVDQTSEILHKKKISESKTLGGDERDFFVLWNGFLRFVHFQK